jgi:2-oxoglutarate ferredoxin oxidoreductase subunit alpha
MSEGYGLAAMTETPLVIIEGMRGGPATGLPTWTEQGDLRFVLHAHQGEFPRIVLAAGDAEEAFHLTMQAFNLADAYQTPVVVMVDKQVCESGFTTPEFDIRKYQIKRGKLLLKKQAGYKRYALVKDGISVRSVPGVGNHVVANSDEHNEHGYSNESAENRIAQMDKRMKKLEMCAQTDMPQPVLYGPRNADLTIVSWGSNKGVILEAMKYFDRVNFLHLTWVSPFPARAVKNVLENARQILNVECNANGQMAGLIKEQTGIGIKHNLLKYDGRPFFPEEIIAKIKKMI